ncbi:MAG: RNA polymerase factor sigma-54 [Saprospiraceae bacterium]|nr:RNA polymerase factor sigma-54 [Saprospiraceae bacterium]
MLKQSLSQKMLQKLSPQQIQLMKLLQIPTATLEERIKEELESNPALEEGDEDYNEVFDLDTDFDNEEKAESEDTTDYELDDYLNQYLEDESDGYKTRGDEYGEEHDRTIPVAVENTFHDQLNRQLGMMGMDTEVDEVIARQIIGSIDEDGYLRREPNAIIDDIMFSQGIEVTKPDVLRVLGIIQRFDPPGVGARDLRECLLLQLQDKIDKSTQENTRARILAMKILVDYFDEFTKKHYQKLKRTYNISDSELKEAIDEILKLNPKPASTMEESSKSSNHYIVPDFIIHNRDGELELSLNNKNAPDLRINDQYAEMLRGYRDNLRGKKSTRKDKEAILFIKQKIDSAKWFIDAIKQRQDTLYRTMYAIMQFQYDYFLTGDERRVRPMILKDIAEVTGLDISTVSRVANSKFVQTEFGTKRLKDFFSESMSTSDGNEVSTVEVKNILNDIIGRENKKRPHSDEKLKDMLQEKGYNIARRTVAKYREQLNIPVARLRKGL